MLYFYYLNLFSSKFYVDSNFERVCVGLKFVVDELFNIKFLNLQDFTASDLSNISSIVIPLDLLGHLSELM